MINQNLKTKLFHYFTQKLGVRPYRRGWLKGNCPSCGKVDKFGINLGTNRTNCFVCEYHPSPFNLVMDLEVLSSYNEVKDFLKVFEGREYIEPILDPPKRVDVILPEGFTSLVFGDNRIGKAARKFIKGRGFDIDEMTYKGWGYCSRGKYFGYIIIPFYHKGKLVYFNARKFMGSGPRYQNPNIEEFGLGKSLILYNADALDLYKRVYLLEGVFNAETLGDEAIASGGKKVSHHQLSHILKKSSISELILLLDPDAVEEMYKISLEVVFHKRVKVVILPEDKDVNDIGKEDSLLLVEKSPWLTYNDLLKLYHNVKHGKRP